MQSKIKQIIRIGQENYNTNFLNQFKIAVTENDLPVDLTGATAQILLYNNNAVSYQWSTESVGERKLTIDANKITVPEIKSWKMNVGIHRGDVDVKLQNNRVITVCTIEFNFTQNVPK